MYKVLVPVFIDINKGKNMGIIDTKKCTTERAIKTVADPVIVNLFEVIFTSWAIYVAKSISG